MGNTDASTYEFYLADINLDEQMDILDIVMLVNLIL